MPPGPVTHRFDTEAEADDARAKLNLLFADHLNRFDGFFETVQDTDGTWAIIERHGRETPRLDVDVARTGNPGPTPGLMS